MIEYTCQSTGIVLKVRPLNPMLVDHLKRGLPKPPPTPTKLVESGPGTAIEVPDWTPAYEEAMAAHSDEIEESLARIHIDLAVSCDVDADVVAQIRANAEAEGASLKGSDKFLYVAFWACGTTAEWNDVIGIIKTGQVRAEEVEAAKDSFRGEVPGQAAGGVAAALDGDEGQPAVSGGAGGEMEQRAVA